MAVNRPGPRSELWRKIFLTVFAIVIFTLAIVLGPEFLWLKILLVALFIVAQFLPIRTKSVEDKR